MSIRCKMRLESVISQTWGGVKAFFRCEYDEDLCKEDKSFSVATPTGNAEFEVNNPKVMDQLVIGKYYYVDFTPIEQNKEK